MFRSISTNEARRPMIRQSLGSLLLVGLLASCAAFAGDSPSIGHTVFMRGQILEVKDSTIVVCIGKADGASVGQELEVIHHSRVKTSPKGVGRFTREVIGKVRIDAIVDEHYAEATIIDGKAGEHDSVELASPAK